MPRSQCDLAGPGLGAHTSRLRSLPPSHARGLPHTLTHYPGSNTCSLSGLSGSLPLCRHQLTSACWESTHHPSNGEPSSDLGPNLGMTVTLTLDLTRGPLQRAIVARGVIRGEGVAVLGEDRPRVPGLSPSGLGIGWHAHRDGHGGDLSAQRLHNPPPMMESLCCRTRSLGTT